MPCNYLLMRFNGNFRGRLCPLPPRCSRLPAVLGNNLVPGFCAAFGLSGLRRIAGVRQIERRDERALHDEVVRVLRPEAGRERQQVRILREVDLREVGFFVLAVALALADVLVVALLSGEAVVDVAVDRCREVQLERHVVPRCRCSRRR